MRCIFCSNLVFGEQGVTVDGHGPGHRHCLETHKSQQRQFGGIDLNTLSDTQLHELEELLKQEKNARSGVAAESVVLF